VRELRLNQSTGTERVELTYEDCVLAFTRMIDGDPLPDVAHALDTDSATLEAWLGPFGPQDFDISEIDALSKSRMEAVSREEA
jgi:hypothetical protein